MDDIPEELGFVSEVIGADIAPCCHSLTMLLKIAAFVIGLLAEARTLSLNFEDFLEYQNNTKAGVLTNISVYDPVTNQTYSAIVQFDIFKPALFSYCFFTGVNVLITFVFLVLHYKKRVFPFIWIPISLFVELPVLICDAFLMKSRGIVDYNDQFWDMLVHVFFILHLPYQLLIDLYSTIGCHSCAMIFLCALCHFLGVMLYAPVWWVMFGWMPYVNISGKIFSQTRPVIQGNARNVMLFLAYAGVSGQTLWMFLILCCVVACLKQCKESE